MKYMSSLRALAAAFLLVVIVVIVVDVEPVSAYSAIPPNKMSHNTIPMITTTTNSPTSQTIVHRREFMNKATLVGPTMLLLSELFSALPAPAHAATTTPTTPTEVLNDVKHGFRMNVPSQWTKQTQELPDRRCIVIWTDPNDPKTALFIAYTPVRDDFTSLSSFGSVDVVASQTILPKGELAGNVGVKAKMLTAQSMKNAYIFDYVQEIENVQPETHFRTIFTLQQGATGGAGAVLVTITLQTPEANYEKVKPLFDDIINSYGEATNTN